MIAGAVISEDGQYRYSLWRHWGPHPARMTFIMFNPSTADGEADDPTIRRCIGFAQREGFDGLEVVNLFAFRATAPGNLPTSRAEAAGPENLWHLQRVLSVSDVVVAAWGAIRVHGGSICSARAEMPVIFESLRRDGKIFALKTTKDGSPGHPLYVKGDASLDPWSGRPGVRPTIVATGRKP